MSVFIIHFKPVYNPKSEHGLRINSVKPAYAATPASQRTIHDRLNIYIFLSGIPWLRWSLWTAGVFTVWVSAVLEQHKKITYYCGQTPGI